MKIENRKCEDGRAILKVSGTLSDKKESAKLIGELENLVNDGEQKFVLDLTELILINEETVDEVIEFFEGIKGEGGELFIA